MLPGSSNIGEAQDPWRGGTAITTGKLNGWACVTYEEMQGIKAKEAGA
jgi:hypothetical protein